MRTSKDLETITLKCLEKEPARRYQSAEEVASELRRVLKDEPIRARPIGGMERTWRWCRRYPIMAGLWSAVVLSLLTGTVLSTLSYVRAEDSRRSERQARIDADTDRQRAVDAEHESRKQRKLAETALQKAQTAVYLANLRLAEESLEKGDLDSARSFISRCPLSLHQWEWRYLNWQLDQSLATSHDHSDYVTAIAFAKEGRQIISGSIDHTVRVWDLGTGTSSLFADLGVVVRGLALSSDGHWMAIVRRDGPIEIWDFEPQVPIHNFGRS